MKKPILIKKIMSKNLKTIDPEATITEAASKMKKFKIGAIVVVKNGNLNGIVTERDILNKVVFENIMPSTILVKEIMTKKVVTIAADKPYYEAISTMTSANVKKIVIVDGKKPIGMLTQTDILKFFSHKWADDFTTD